MYVSCLESKPNALPYGPPWVSLLVGAFGPFLRWSLCSAAVVMREPHDGLREREEDS